MWLERAGIVMEKSFFTYIVECADGTYYTGYTTDVQRRVESHNHSTRGAKYTRSRRPVHLVYCEKKENRHDAMAREAEIKRLTRRQKEALVRQWETGEGSLSPEIFT